MLVPKYYTML